MAINQSILAINQSFWQSIKKIFSQRFKMFCNQSNKLSIKSDLWQIFIIKRQQHLRIVSQFKKMYYLFIWNIAKIPKKHLFYILPNCLYWNIANIPIVPLFQMLLKCQWSIRCWNVHKSSFKMALIPLATIYCLSFETLPKI